MEFLDNSGHIFSLPSYKEEPIGYEFEENKYVFWVESTTNDLSINNFYCKVINIVIPFDNDDDNILFNDIVDVNISIDSNKFWLLSPENIQNSINGLTNLNDLINLSVDEETEEDYKKKTLTNDDLFILSLNKDDEIIKENDIINWPCNNLAIIPIYILSNSNEEGTWMTNILIHISNKDNSNAVEEDWCPITVGALYVKENEILTINGQNLGINLPKDIFKAVYQCSFVNDKFDESLYNEKIKEYIINYMSIKGEIGNYKSAINSLKWFGYGDKITLTKLIKTDNEIKNQYINDFFDISNDLLKSFRYFRNTTLLSLKLKDNQETSETYDINMNDYFWGEGKPIMEDLFNKYVEVKEGYDNTKWSYWKPYYDFTFYEMGLKLSCLKYYYETYFLPIHLKLHSASVTHQVFANDIKFNNYVYGTNITEPLINLEDSYIENNNEYILNNDDVRFDSNNVRYFTHQLHFVDENFNEFTYKKLIVNENEEINENDIYIDDEDDLYKIDETCLNIPIHFKQNDKLYNCVLILEKERKDTEFMLPYELKVINHPINLFYYDLKIKNTENKIIDLNKLSFAYIKDNEVSSYIQGIDNFKEYLKNNFKYTFSINNINNFKFTNIEYLKTFFNEDDTFNDEPQEINDIDKYIYIPSIDELGVNPMNSDDIIGYVYIIPKVDLVIKYNENEINDFIIYHKDINLSLLNNIKINKIKETTFVYESHFSFIQSESKKYHSFVLYPKILNKNNINYFVDQKFILNLLVNNKWYKYEFISKMPDLNLEFGTLKYKYWDNCDNYTSPFTQLKDFCPNRINDNGEIEKGSIEFNSFMYEPDLIKVNHINYIEDINTYIKLNNLLYVSNDYPDLKLGNFNKYIIVKYIIIIDNEEIIKEIKVYFHKNLDLNNQILGEFYVPNNLSNYKSLRVLDDNNIFGELITGGFEKINKDTSDIKIEQTGLNIYKQNNNILSVNHIVLSEVENMHQKYINKININEFNELNNIHIFDIYKTPSEKLINNILYLHNVNLNVTKNDDIDDDNDSLFYIKGIYEDDNYKIILNKEDFINEYKLDLNENNDEETSSLIASLFINKFSDLYNIENLNINDYEKVNIDNFGYFKYINNNTNNYIEMYDKNDNYLTKNIYIKISYYSKNNNEKEIENISEIDYNKLLNDEESNNIIIKVDFYENIKNKNIEQTLYYTIEENNNEIKINNKLYKWRQGIGSTITFNINDDTYTFSGTLYPMESSTAGYYVTKNGETNNIPLTKNIENLIIDNNIYKIPFKKFSNINEISLNTLKEAGLIDNSIKSTDKICLKFEYESNDNVKIIIEKENSEKTISIIENENPENPITNYDIELNNGDILRFYLHVDSNNINNLDNICIIPKLYLKTNEYKQLEYNYKDDDYDKNNDENNSLIIDGKKYFYGNNTSSYVVDLYNDFFKKDEDKDILENKSLIMQKVNLNNMYLDYDFYLMHDFEYWYGVFISKQPISKTYTPDQLKINKDDKKIILEIKESDNINNIKYSYELRYLRSGNEFLINRMKYIPNNSINHFNSKDMIVGKILSNNKLPVNIFDSSKWEITPMSIGLSDNIKINSNSEMCLLSFPKTDNRYKKGYYNVNVRYSLDGNTQQQYIKTGKIRID